MNKTKPTNQIIEIGSLTHEMGTYFMTTTVFAMPCNPGVIVMTETERTNAAGDFIGFTRKELFLPDGVIEHKENGSAVILSQPETVEKVDLPKNIKVSEENETTLKINDQVVGLVNESLAAWPWG